jgi:hypothetical protein
VGIEWRGPLPQSTDTAGRDGGAVDLIVDLGNPSRAED